MNFGGLIAGALGGAAKGYEKYAESELKKQQQADLARQLSEIEEQKELRLDEIKRNRDLRDIPIKGEAQTKVEVARADALRPGQIKLAEAQANINTTAEQQRTTHRTDERLREDETTRKRDIEGAPARAEAEAKALIGQVGTRGFTDALRKKAQATHIDSPAAKAQARLAELSIEEKREAQALIREFENPSTTETRRAAIMRALTVRGIVKPGEFDTEKVTTETMDDQGNVTKTERTQRRTTNNSSSATGAPAVQPPSAAIEALKNNPALQSQFDAKYGPGSAARYLR